MTRKIREKDTFQAEAGDWKPRPLTPLAQTAELAMGRGTNLLGTRVAWCGLDAPVLGASMQQGLAAMPTVVRLHGLEFEDLAFLLGAVETA